MARRLKQAGEKVPTKALKEAIEETKPAPKQEAPKQDDCRIVIKGKKVRALRDNLLDRDLIQGGYRTKGDRLYFTMALTDQLNLWATMAHVGLVVTAMNIESTEIFFSEVQ